MVFLTMTPRYLPKLSLRLKAQFLFGQLWYFLFSGAMLSSYLLPLLAGGARRLVCPCKLL